MKERRHPDQQQFDIFAKDYDKRFIETYRPVYKIFQEQLFKVLKTFKEPLRILDLGCGNGWTAEQIVQVSHGVYVGIDPSEASLGILNERLALQKNFKVFTLCHSAEWICKEKARAELSEKLGGNPQLIICNAAFHQIRKTFPGIHSLIISLQSFQAAKGVALLGDYYYPKNLLPSEIQEALHWIKKKTGQNPTPPDAWFRPDEIHSILENTGYNIEEIFEVQANPEICLKYYLIKAAKERSNGA